MNQRLRYFLLGLIGLIGGLSVAPGWAQGTITTEALKVTAVCPGSLLDVTFTTDSPYGAGNVFTAELFDQSAYRSLPTSTARVVFTNRVSAIWLVSVTLPADALPGADYQLRIRASNPAVTGLPSPTRLTIREKPAPPTVPVVPTSFCQNQTTRPLSATATGEGVALVWYGTDATGGVGTPEATRPSSVSAGAFRYYVAQRLAGCESERAAVPVVIQTTPTATLTGPSTSYEGQPVSLSVAFTGAGPWQFSYQDSSYATGAPGAVQPVDATANPYVLTVTPAKTTAYYLTGVRNGCGPGTHSSERLIVNAIPLLGVEDPALADAIDVFPIPATTSLTVRIRGIAATQPALLELTNLAGRSTDSYRTKHETTLLPLDAYPTGTYILRIRVGEQTTTKRIVKF